MFEKCFNHILINEHPFSLQHLLIKFIRTIEIIRLCMLRKYGYIIGMAIIDQFRIYIGFGNHGRIRVLQSKFEKIAVGGLFNVFDV